MQPHSPLPPERPRRPRLTELYVRKLEVCNLGAWLGTPGPWGTVGRPGNIWKRTESRTSGRIEESRMVHYGPLW